MKRSVTYILLLILVCLPGLAFADSANHVLSSYNLFTPPLTDKSVNYLGQVFGTMGGVLHGTSGQLLSEVFRIFNYAMVILASGVMVYTVVLSVLNTAHEGEFMGKQINSGWAIIRAVTGIGILVPKYTGYSLIQVFIMWVTVQGIGLADSTWGRAIDYLSDEGGVVYSAPAETLSKDNGMSKTFGVASQVFNSEVCMYKLQDIARKQQTDARNQLKTDPNNPTLQALANQTYPQYRPVWNNNSSNVSFGFPSSNPATSSVCGQYSWNKFEVTDSRKGFDQYKKSNPSNPIAPNVPEVDFGQYIRMGLEQMVSDTTPSAKSVAEASGAPEAPTPAQTKNLRDRVVRGLLGGTADYENIMRPALQRATRLSGFAWQKNLQEAKEKGWIVAGSYYWDLAKINNKLMEQLKSYQPAIDIQMSKDKLDRSGVNGQIVMTTIEQANKDLGIKSITDLLKVLEDKVGSAIPPDYKAALLQSLDNLSSTDPATKNAAFKNLETVASQMTGNVDKAQNVFNNSTLAVSAGTIALASAPIIANPATTGIGVMLGAVLGSLVGLWFGVMNSPGDPIAMVSQLGQGMVGLAIGLWILGTASLAVLTGMLSIMGSATGAAYGIQNGLKLFVPVIVGFIGVLFVNGMVLSVYVPLIPFMIFTFAAIGWMISVLEAVVAGPLVAAALTRPEGHDLLGKSEQAIMLLLGVFLRPVVMIIGFLAAIILSRVTLRLVNAGFSHAVESSGMTWSGANLFSMAGIMIVYTMIVISLINMVFNAGVVKLWETIWLWIGFNQHSSTSGEQAMQEIKGGLHSGAQAMSDTIGGMGRASADMVGEMGAALEKQKGEPKGVSVANDPKKPQDGSQ